MKEKQLSQEQIDKIPQYVEKFNSLTIKSGNTDKAKAEAAITRLYNHLSKTDEKFKKDPEIVWADGPHAGAKLAAQYAKGDVNVTQDEIVQQADTASFGTFEAFWVSTYSFIAKEVDKSKDVLIDIVEDVVTHCGVFWTFEDLVVLTPIPTKIHIKDDKLHNENGPCVEYPNGEAVFAINGEYKDSLMSVAIANRAARAEKLNKGETETEEGTN
jgi:hypothetical protein